MVHVLVTNDFPPKVGGIQSYLGALWDRLPAGEAVVLTTATGGPETDAYDRSRTYPVVRRGRALLPSPGVTRAAARLVREHGAGLILLDPAFPLGILGPRLAATTGTPYGVILHGAEVTVPGRVPFLRPVLARTVLGADLVVAAGGYPAAEAAHAAGRPVPNVSVPPGVDTKRFVPLAAPDRAAARCRFGLPAEGTVVLGVSRLVPRKGFDRVIRAVATLVPSRPDLHVVIAGGGRDAERLQTVANDAGVAVRFLGRVDDADLPALYGCADVFAMACRDRWAGLEQEGFGIVFLEAAACGVPQVAGRSGGAHEAVVDEVTGLVVDDPRSVDAVARALARLVDHPDRARVLGAAARERAVASFDLDRLAARLLDALREAEDRGRDPARARSARSRA